MKLNTFKQSILAYLCNLCRKQFQSKFLSMVKNIIIFEINITSEKIILILVY